MRDRAPNLERLRFIQAMVAMRHSLRDLSDSFAALSETDQRRALESIQGLEQIVDLAVRDVINAVPQLSANWNRPREKAYEGR
jgi:hypothetical protein